MDADQVLVHPLLKASSPGAEKADFLANLTNISEGLLSSRIIIFYLPEN